MSNCIDQQWAVSWVKNEESDSNESTSPDGGDHKDNISDEDQARREGGTPSTEVKIKITWKQLGKLLKQVYGKELRIQQILSVLMSNN